MRNRRNTYSSTSRLSRQTKPNKPKLKMFTSAVPMFHDSSRVKTLTVASRRITGVILQRRRLDVWSKNPVCNHCQLFVSYPSGFELDHIIPLWQGGQDVESNCQILCVECHKKKTKKDG